MKYFIKKILRYFAQDFRWLGIAVCGSITFMMAVASYKNGSLVVAFIMGMATTVINSSVFAALKEENDE